MKRFALVGCLAAVLAGCGGGGSDSAAAPTCKAVNVSSLGAVQLVTVNEPTNLTIGGLNNTVNIEGASNICTLAVPGQSNLIHFNNSMTVNTCTTSGMSNTIEKPTAMALNCTDSGMGNIINNY